MYAAGSEKEKGAGGRLHGGTIAHLFVFCKRGVAGAPDSGVRPPMGTDGFVLACALDERRVWLGLRRCPTWPTLQRLGYRGTPGGGCAPCTPLGERRGASSPAAEYGGKDKMRLLDGWSCCGLRPPSAEGLAWRAPLSHRPTLRRFWKQGDALYPPAGAAPPAPCWGRGFVGACAILQGMVWLGVRRCPTGPPSNVIRNRGTPPVPRLGERGGVGAAGRFLTFRWVRGVGRGEGGWGSVALLPGRFRAPILTFPRVQGQGQSSPRTPLGGGRELALARLAAS